MKRVIRWICLVVMISVLATLAFGCVREADVVSENLSKQADAFNITRRVVVYNTRTDKVWLEVIGLISIDLDSDGDLNIIMEVDNDVYKKHIVNLNGWTTYVLEDITGAYVDKYHYEINYQPEMIVPITVTSYD